MPLCQRGMLTISPGAWHGCLGREPAIRPRERHPSQGRDSVMRPWVWQAGECYITAWCHTAAQARGAETGTYFYALSHTPKQHKFQTEELIHRPEQDIGDVHVCERDGEVNRNYMNVDFRCEHLKALLPRENAMTNLSAWVHTMPSVSTYLAHLPLPSLAVPDSLKA